MHAVSAVHSLPPPVTMACNVRRPPRGQPASRCTARRRRRGIRPRSRTHGAGAHARSAPVATRPRPAAARRPPRRCAVGASATGPPRCSAASRPRPPRLPLSYCSGGARSPRPRPGPLSWCRSVGVPSSGAVPPRPCVGHCVPSVSVLPSPLSLPILPVSPPLSSFPPPLPSPPLLPPRHRPLSRSPPSRSCPPAPSSWAR